MKKTIALFFALTCMQLAKAQYALHCGTQSFTIQAKKCATVKQIDPSTKAETITTCYYSFENNKLKVWVNIGDSQTRSLSLYEIEKSAIDPSISFEIVEFDQQEYTAPVKDLFIKCKPGNNDVQVTGYVDWTANADKFSWSFISVTAYDKQALEQMKKEINNWLSH